MSCKTSTCVNFSILTFVALNNNNREDLKKQKLLDEARKAGKAPALVDEEGHAINPHIPEYIVKAPWYLNTGQPSLKHQRKTSKGKEPSAEAHQIKGIIQTDDQPTKFRKGACENCGSMTHKTKDCLERPRKVGAKHKPVDIKPDEFIIEGPQDFDGKRDRWAGFDHTEYDKVIEKHKEIELERQRLKETETESDLRKNLEQDEVDEEKYAEAVDMPGQKLDTKTRMTVRNLRIREDTAKYLRNLDPDSAYYDPKTRSMRENPNQDVELEKLTYAGDNFVRISGDATKVTDIQVFAWQAYERGEDISLQANPSVLEKMYKEHTEKKEKEKRKLAEALLNRYGDQDEVQQDHEEALLEESDVYIEYTPSGKVAKTSHSKFNY